MATKFEVESTKGDIFSFWPEDIVVRPKLNGRYEQPDLQGLIDSILSVGQLQPVKVRREEGKPVLVLGHGRWQAISTINKKELAGNGVRLKIKAVYTELNEADSFIENIHENFYRNQTSPIDDAHNIQLLRKWGKTDEEIGKIYGGKDAAWIAKRAKLALLEPEMQKAMNDGRVKITAAASIAKLSAAQQRDVAKGKDKIKAPKKEKKEGGALPKSQLVEIMENEKTPPIIAAFLKYSFGKFTDEDYETWKADLGVIWK